LSNLKHFLPHSLSYVERMPRPRFVKTHLPLSLLPEDLLDKAKVIFVARDVRDIAVSLYHHVKLKAR